MWGCVDGIDWSAAPQSGSTQPARAMTCQQTSRCPGTLMMCCQNRTHNAPATQQTIQTSQGTALQRLKFVFVRTRGAHAVCARGGGSIGHVWGCSWVVRHKAPPLVAKGAGGSARVVERPWGCTNSTDMVFVRQAVPQAWTKDTQGPLATVRHSGLANHKQNAQRPSSVE